MGFLTRVSERLSFARELESLAQHVPLVALESVSCAPQFLLFLCDLLEAALQGFAFAVDLDPLAGH